MSRSRRASASARKAKASSASPWSRMSSASARRRAAIKKMLGARLRPPRDSPFMERGARSLLSSCSMDAQSTATSHTPRPGLVTAAGIAIILLGVGAAALPFLDRVAGNRVVGSLLLAAGNGRDVRRLPARPDPDPRARSPGAVTTVAGVLFLIEPGDAFRADDQHRHRLAAGARADPRASPRCALTVGAALDRHFRRDRLRARPAAAGRPVDRDPDRHLVRADPYMVASFAWIFALSFFITGGLLLEIASCEREQRRDELINAVLSSRRARATRPSRWRINARRLCPPGPLGHHRR